MKKTTISEDELLKQKQLQETKNNESLKRFILEQTESLKKGYEQKSNMQTLHSSVQKITCARMREV